MTPASPLPWSVEVLSRVLRIVSGVEADGPFGDDVAIFGTDSVYSDKARQDARYIVTACNAFPALVEALKAVVDPSTPFGVAVQQARAVLAQVERGE